MDRSRRNHRIVVIGAGIGGLTTAALLAQAGHKVVVLERNTYPGGCAATFYHKGYRFDTGATVVGGFQSGGSHAIVGERLGITWPVRPIETSWVVHLPDRCIPMSQDKAELLNQFPKSAGFWQTQEQVADIGWKLAAMDIPWKPGNGSEWMHLSQIAVKNIPDGFRILPYAFTTAYGWLKRHGLEQDAAFVRFLDAQLLISAQTTSQFANALYSATALDLVRKGVVHVQGGVGQLAESLAEKVNELGGEIRYRHNVTAITTEGNRATGVSFHIGKRDTKTEWFPCDFVVANSTPATLGRLLQIDTTVKPAVNTTAQGWGAFVMHVGVDADALPHDMADHHQIISDWESPLGEGRSIFLSLSPAWDETRAPAGKRAVTITTHTEVQQWWHLYKTDYTLYNERKLEYVERILQSIERFLPGFRKSIALMLAGTPITYQYYTGRDKGMVGGFPQTSIFHAKGPHTSIPNVLMVGDSVFPGQSTAGVTVGAMRVARNVIRLLNT